MTTSYAITLFARRVPPEALHQVRGFLESRQFRILTVRRIHEHEFHRIEIIAERGNLRQSPHPLELRKELLAFSTGLNIDLALQREDIYRRPKKILVMDLDSTLIRNEVIDELARERGSHAIVAEITKRAMEGQMDFDESLTQRCTTLRGLRPEHLERVYSRLEFTPGALDLITSVKKIGYKVGLITGGFSFVSDRIKKQLGLDYAFANTLEIQNGVLTGRVIPPIVNAQRKADLLEQIALREGARSEECVAIGDGANDIFMLAHAGLGIAFNAKPAVRQSASLALNQPSLRSVLYLLVDSPEDLEKLSGARTKS